MNSFEHFLHDQSDVPIYDVDANLMVKYEVWLKAEGVCPNTSSFYMRNLRAIYNRAVQQGITLQKYPFKQVYTGISKTMKRAVSLSVIRQIRDLHLSDESLIFSRDLFMFSFYTRGMSFVDIAFLKKKDLQHGFLVYRRNKTGQQLLVKWEKPMQDLIDKYTSPSTPYLLPILENNMPNVWHQYQNFIHRVNRHLKKIGWMIGLGFPLTTYVARHAWASIAQSRCISLAVISEALGHESEKTTKIYLSSLDTTRVDNANRLILELL